MTATTPKAIDSVPGFRSAIFDAQQLSMQPYLEHLRTMINDAFHSSHVGMISADDPDSHRFSSTDELSSVLGVHGRCCLVFHDHDHDRPVASAMIKYLNSDLSALPFDTVDAGSVLLGGYEKEPEDVRGIEHWEILAVAISADDPSLKSRGLAAHMARRLEQDARARMQASKLEMERCKVQENGSGSVAGSGHDAAFASDSPRYAPEVTFWAKATMRANAPYWQRRGFDRVRVDVHPKGYWGALEDIHVMTLKKEVPSTMPVET